MASPGRPRGSTPSKQQQEALQQAFEHEKATNADLTDQLRTLNRQKRDICKKLDELMGTLIDPKDDPLTGDRKQNGELATETRRTAALQTQLEEFTARLESATNKIKDLESRLAQAQASSPQEIASLRSENTLLQDEAAANAAKAAAQATAYDELQQEHYDLQQAYDEKVAEVDATKDNKSTLESDAGKFAEAITKLAGATAAMAGVQDSGSAQSNYTDFPNKFKQLMPKELVRQHMHYSLPWSRIWNWVKELNTTHQVNYSLVCVFLADDYTSYLAMDSSPNPYTEDLYIAANGAWKRLVCASQIDPAEKTRMERDDFIKPQLGEQYFVQAYKRDLKHPPSGRMFDPATETVKLQNEFWSTRYKGESFRLFFVSLQTFREKSMDAIFTNQLFNDAHFRANFRTQLGEYVPTSGKLDMALSGPLEGPSFYARTQRLRHALSSGVISIEFPSLYPVPKDFWLAVYTDTMSKSLKATLVSWADTNLQNEYSPETSGSKFIYEFEALLSYLEKNEGHVTAQHARAQQAKSDARSNRPGTPGQPGAAAALVDPNGMARPDVTALNRLYNQTCTALAAQGLKDDTKNERLAADKARIGLTKTECSNANFQILANFISTNNKSASAAKLLKTIAETHDFTTVDTPAVAPTVPQAPAYVGTGGKGGGGGGGRGRGAGGRGSGGRGDTTYVKICLICSQSVCHIGGKLPNVLQACHCPVLKVIAQALGQQALLNCPAIACGQTGQWFHTRKVLVTPGDPIPSQCTGEPSTPVYSCFHCTKFDENTGNYFMSWSCWGGKRCFAPKEQTWHKLFPGPKNPQFDYMQICSGLMATPAAPPRMLPGMGSPQPYVVPQPNPMMTPVGGDHSANPMMFQDDAVSIGSQSTLGSASHSGARSHFCNNANCPTGKPGKVRLMIDNFPGTYCFACAADLRQQGY